jgi:hypothetical protein
MKKIFIYIITLVINATVFSQTNSAVTEKTETAPPPTAASKITGSFEMNYLRHYLWRGLLFGNNDVAQPELELSYKNFTLALAQNFNYVPKNVPVMPFLMNRMLKSGIPGNGAGLAANSVRWLIFIFISVARPIRQN